MKLEQGGLPTLPSAIWQGRGVTLPSVIWKIAPRNRDTISGTKVLEILRTSQDKL